MSRVPHRTATPAERSNHNKAVADWFVAWEYWSRLPYEAQVRVPEPEYPRLPDVEPMRAISV